MNIPRIHPKTPMIADASHINNPRNSSIIIVSISN